MAIACCLAVFSPYVPAAERSAPPGEARSRGFALRGVPDRSVDNRYISRVDLASPASVRLELEVYKW